MMTMMMIIVMIMKVTNNNICELSYLWSKMNLGLFLLVIFRGAFADKKNELCAKIVHGFQPLTIFGKSSILDV